MTKEIIFEFEMRIYVFCICLYILIFDNLNPNITILLPYNKEILSILIITCIKFD